MATGRKGVSNYPLTGEQQNIKTLYNALTLVEKGGRQALGLEFGKACYEYRERLSTGGRPKKSVSGETVSFESFCDENEIARATAYRWIARYEESIGVREPKPEPVLVPDDVPNDVDAGDVDVAPDETDVPAAPQEKPPAKVKTKEESLKEDLQHIVHRLNSLLLAVKDLPKKYYKFQEVEEMQSLIRKIYEESKGWKV